MRDEARDTLHHPLTSPLAAHVDVAIIRVAEVAVATTLNVSDHNSRLEALRSAQPVRVPGVFRADAEHRPAPEHPVFRAACCGIPRKSGRSR